MAKNYFDKNGNYINVENLSLAEIYNRGYQDGAEDGLQGIRPKGEWYDYMPENCLKARHGNYVLYKIDYLLKNLAREIYLLESARRMKGGAE
jgi:hypothetical protein